MGAMIERSLAEIAAGVEAGQVTALALAEAALDRHRAFGPLLGAYMTMEPERVLAQARASDALRAAGQAPDALFGVPVSVKDLYGISGYPTYAGTPRRLPPEWEREGFLVSNLRRLGATFTGKTHTAELARSGLGVNFHHGTPRNPWDAEIHRVPGGSSAGAGVSLIEGSALIALGTDTGGSIRIPASMTGTVGFKSSNGRWPIDRVVPLSPTLDCVGGLTRTVADMAWFFAAVDPASEDPRRSLARRQERDAAGLRIGLLDCEGWDESPGDIADCVRDALAELERASARVVPCAMPEYDEAGAIYRRSTVPPIECGAFLAAELPEWLPLLHETTARGIRENANFPVRDYLLTLRDMARLTRLVDDPLRSFDALATPTVAMSPPALADVTEIDAYLKAMPRSGFATAPANILGLCALSVPVGLDSHGLPVGLQLIGRAGSDSALLETGLAVEAVLGTVDRRLGRAPLGAPRGPQ